MEVWALRYLPTPVLPVGAKIVTFPSLPDAMLGRWTEKSAVRTPGEHLKWIWQRFRSGKKWRKHLSRYVQKADWIAEHWRV